ncbi:MAG: hypothetical protein HY791_19980 [Deltaproteobacteria bacterium]|nr:hypothetical protein [Deltaproteobacteria bacterium]
MSSNRRLLFLFASVAFACAEDTTPLDGGVDASSADVDGGTQPDARTDAEVMDGSRDVGPHDSGRPSDSGIAPGTPLLDRAVDPRVNCSVEAGLASQAPRSWYQGGHAVVNRGGEAILVRTESNPPTPFDPAPTNLVFGPLEATGALGAVETIRAIPEGVSVSAPGVAVAGDQLFVIWAESAQLSVAIDGPSGVMGPTQLGWSATEFSRVAVAAGHGGIGLIFSNYDFDSGRYTTAFGRVSAAGTPTGNPVVIRIGTDDPSATLVATTSGWAVLLRRDSDFVFLPLAIDGTPGAPRVLVPDGELVAGRGAGFDRPRHALLPTVDGFLAAWVESKPTFDAGAFSGIRLASLSSAGELNSQPIWVRAPEVDIDEVEPELTWFGQNVALSWARGHHIYICAGCMPDHEVDTVVFDPSSMIPVSSVVTIDPPTRGGLLRRSEAWVGDTLRMAFSITFHVHGEPGTAVVRCQ